MQTTATYNCLNCRYSVDDVTDEPAANVKTCPKCGRDMYLAKPGGAAAKGGGLAKAGSSGLAGVAPAIPSRYAGVVGTKFMPTDPDLEKSVIVPHTPLIVILGLIFAFIFGPAGVILSILGLRLVNDSPPGIRGREMAIAGIALGSVTTVLYVILYFARNN